MLIEYFILIDRIRSLSIEESRIQCESTVPAESSIYQGHFPGHPILPGVLLVEAMAQAGGWLILALQRGARFPFLSKIDDAKLRDFVTPGTELLVEAKLLHDGSGFAKTENRVRVGDKVVCECVTTFRLLPYPNPTLRAHVASQGRRIGMPPELFANAG